MALLPLVAGAQYVSVGIFAGIDALAAIGLQQLMGVACQVSLGQAGFFRTGGYTVANTVTLTDRTQPAIDAGG